MSFLQSRREQLQKESLANQIKTETPQEPEVIEDKIIVEAPPIIEAPIIKEKPPIDGDELNRLVNNNINNHQETKELNSTINNNLKPKKSKPMLNTLNNTINNSLKKKRTKKAIKAATKSSDDARGLELNKNTEIDGNVHTARLFKSICKKKNLKINQTLQIILSKWNAENA